ncbi:MAG: peptide deformylase [Candidatus Magasanikiibacteriota bacterium]
MLEITKIPTPSLRQRSAELDPVLILTEEIQNLIIDMIPTMYQSDGIGLAAPQVGKNIRLCTIGKEALKVDKKNTLPVEDLVLINPVWQKLSVRKTEDVEGCLSVPKTFGKVKRYKKIEVIALDKNGKKIKFEAHDFFARVIQHEVDHLDGILFIDKATGIYQVE